MTVHSTRELSCGDVTGMSGAGAPCAFKATGESDADVPQQLMAHAKNDHGLAVTTELVQTARAAIRAR